MFSKEFAFVGTSGPKHYSRIYYCPILEYVQTSPVTNILEKVGGINITALGETNWQRCTQMTTCNNCVITF